MALKPWWYAYISSSLLGRGYQLTHVRRTLTPRLCICLKVESTSAVLVRSGSHLRKKITLNHEASHPLDWSSHRNWRRQSSLAIRRGSPQHVWPHETHERLSVELELPIVMTHKTLRGWDGFERLCPRKWEQCSQKNCQYIPHGGLTHFNRCAMIAFIHIYWRPILVPRRCCFFGVSSGKSSASMVLGSLARRNNKQTRSGIRTTVIWSRNEAKWNKQEFRTSNFPDRDLKSLLIAAIVIFGIGQATQRIFFNFMRLD